MKKILLSGEGKSDYGIEDSMGNWKEGPVQVFMRRCRPDEEMIIVPFDRKANRRGRTFKIQRHKNLKGHALEAFALAVEAYQQKADTAAFYVDADREAGKTEHECRKRYALLKNEILTGMQSVPGVMGIAVIPIKMIESWMMGDQGALERLYGKARSKADFPAHPELDWGAKDDPDSNFPKNRLRRVLAVYGQEPSREVFCEIAEEADLRQLCRTCSISFQDFYEQMQELS